MFTHLPTNTKIYAVSAANPSESSWGTYCSPDDIVGGKHIGSCLGDLFSVKWMEDTEANQPATETLQQQFEAVKKQTTKSHVMQWGDVSFVGDVVGDFVGGSIHLKDRNYKLKEKPRTKMVDSRFAKIKMLTWAYKQEQTQEAYWEMREEMNSMQKFDDIFHPLIRHLSLNG